MTVGGHDGGVPYPPIEKLVPHGPPMRAIERLVEWAPGRAICELHVRDTMPFVQKGRVASVVTLEYMAQAVAACLGHEAYVSGGGIRVGMLIGLRRMELLRPSIAVGSRVLIEVERQRGNDEVSTFRGETRVGDTLVATAILTLFHAEHPPDT